METTKFQLPGAENFTKFLEERVEGILTVEGPEVVDRTYDNRDIKSRIIKLNGNRLGEYLTSDTKSDQNEFDREYRGRIPDYKNKLIAEANKFRLETKRIPEDEVFLIYSRKRDGFLHCRSPGKLVDAPWKRQDGHETIPFP